jgi:hypothetical protein
MGSLVCLVSGPYGDEQIFGTLGWLQFVERKWSTSIYGTERKKRRYRLPKSSKPDVRQRLHNLKKLTEKLDGAPSQSRLSDKLQ